MSREELEQERHTHTTHSLRDGIIYAGLIWMVVIAFPLSFSWCVLSCCFRLHEPSFRGTFCARDFMDGETQSTSRNDEITALGHRNYIQITIKRH